MILTLDIGNSQIYGGVFEGEKLTLQFRKTCGHGHSSDEFGLFLREVLRENGIDYKKIGRIAMCSVVPDAVYSLNSACMKYFKLRPFTLQAGVKTGLKLKYKNPLEIGADRIAGAVAAVHLYPARNLIIADFGTATTLCVITKEKEYIGGIILAGLRISMKALETETAKLPSVEISAPKELVGQSTVESIRSGLYFGHLCALKGLTAEIAGRYFRNEKPLIIGTGGFSRLFEREKIFDFLVPELVLIGLKKSLEMNRGDHEKNDA